MSLYSSSWFSRNNSSDLCLMSVKTLRQALVQFSRPLPLKCASKRWYSTPGSYQYPSLPQFYYMHLSFTTASVSFSTSRFQFQLSSAEPLPSCGASSPHPVLPMKSVVLALQYRAASRNSLKNCTGWCELFELFHHSFRSRARVSILFLALFLSGLLPIPFLFLSCSFSFSIFLFFFLT